LALNDQIDISQAPMRARTTIHPAIPAASGVAMVNTGHQPSAVKSPQRSPSRSAIQPPGKLNSADDCPGERYLTDVFEAEAEFLPDCRDGDGEIHPVHLVYQDHAEHQRDHAISPLGQIALHPAFAADSPSFFLGIAREC
jgi:hypothetical protein